MIVDSPYLATPGKKFDLNKAGTDDTGKFKDKSDGRDATAKNLEHLDELQEVLYAQAKHAVLIVLQAMDAGGKDGTIESIFSGVNPQGCTVTSFKAPSTLEFAHDYLWRIHNACPPHGMIGIFNRSHYESVGVERIKSIAPKNVWSKRFDHINEFERMLSDEGTTIIKFFLHISRDEQNQRMKSRLEDPKKRWKFNPSDVIDDKTWSAYMEAYSDAITNCSTKHAPWYVVPADTKWFRNWVVSDVIVRTMKKLDLKYPIVEE